METVSHKHQRCARITLLLIKVILGMLHKVATCRVAVIATVVVLVLTRIAVIEYEYKSVLSETKERTHRALWLYGGVKRQQQALKTL